MRDNQGVEWFRLDEEFRQYDAQQGGALWARPDKTGSVRESHLMVWRGPLIPVLDVKFLFEKPTGFKRVVAHRSRTAVSDGE